MEIIGIYIMLGVLVNLLIDLLFSQLEKRNYVNVTEEDIERFDNMTRFIVLLIWPIFVVYVIISILKEYTK
tara:strand:- start:1191 stop:1403 length:213 start_codon:yes stop_codon:yes gene_type:complete